MLKRTRLPKFHYHKRMILDKLYAYYTHGHIGDKQNNSDVWDGIIIKWGDIAVNYVNKYGVGYRFLQRNRLRLKLMSLDTF